MFFLSGFALSDFSFSQENGTPFGVPITSNGPFPLPGGPGATATLSNAAQPVDIFVNDDDPDLNDAFLEIGAGNNLSTLASDVTIGSQTFDAGTVVEAEFFFTTDTGEEFIFVSLGGAGSNDGDLALILSTTQINPGDTLTFVNSTDGPSIPYNTIVCFTRGTRIETPDGEVPIERLSAGDCVTGTDGRVLTVKWIGSRRLNTTALATQPHLRPIRIAAGALGRGLPRRELCVSPQHRMLVDDWRSELLFGEREVLVPAKALVNDRDIRVLPVRKEVEYFHILFDRHEVISAEGAPSESFHPGETALSSLDWAARDEVLTLFPELAKPDGIRNFGPTARPVLRPFEAAALTGSLR
ncbi:MAG: Hint domain-containing protein [Pseudomonadota bacterium]